MSRLNLGKASTNASQINDLTVENLTVSETLSTAVQLDFEFPTPLPVNQGGTGSQTASDARNQLGVAIGSNVQAYDAGLASIAGLTTSANKMIYTTALDTYTTTDLTSFARNLLDDADASTARTTLGLGSIATQNSNNVTITGGTISLSDPVSSGQVATKNYVDSLVAGLAIKQPVRCATTVAGTLASSFVTDSIIDGVELIEGDRILIKNQTDQKENGIYVVKASGAPDRSTDADNSPDGEVRGGMFCFVQEGTTNAETGWVLTSPDGVAVLGTDNLVFSQFSAFTYTADGNGITVSNREFSLTYGSTANTVCEGNDSRLLGTSSTPTFSELTLAKAGTGVTNSLTVNAGLTGDPSTSNISKLRLQTQAGGGGTVTTDLQQYYDGSDYSVALTDGTTTNLKINNSTGAIYSRGLGTSGYVKSTSGALSTSTTIPNTDITGLGTMSTATASDYLAKADNLSGLGNTTTARSNLGLGTMAVATATDYLAKADNLSGLGDTTTARSNLGLGTMAVATATDYLAKADNLSGLTNTTTARSNLGLGTMAVATATDYLAKADNLSGLGNTTTARSNLGLGAIATQSIPASGYVTSNGTTLSSTTTVPSSDVVFNSGFTIVGGAINLNDSSNYAVNVGTGTNTQATTIGNTGNDFTGIAGSEVGIGVADEGTLHICDTYWVTDTPEQHVNIGNANAGSTVTIVPNTGFAGNVDIEGDLQYNTDQSVPLHPIGNSYQPRLRIISGRVNMDDGSKVGDADMNDGFTASGSGGAVTITFSTAFSVAPHIVLTPYYSSIATGVACRLVPNVTTSVAVINTFNTGTGALISNDGLIDIEVFFTAIGY